MHNEEWKYVAIRRAMNPTTTRLTGVNPFTGIIESGCLNGRKLGEKNHSKRQNI